MNDVVHHFIDSLVIVYLYDISSSSVSWEDHITHLKKVLKALNKHQLMANFKKCDYTRQYLVYLGYVIDGECKIDPTKMEAIIKKPTSTNVTEIRSFFGLQNIFGIL